MKIYWLLTTIVLVVYSFGLTISGNTHDKLSTRRSERVDLNRMQIVSQPNDRFRLQILLPLYIYPNWYDKKNYIWQQVITAAKKVSIVAIINPNNGPDRAPPNADYRQGINDLRQAGVKLIGYVPSNYAKRDLQAVEADIALYIKYFNVDGIFIDEAASTPDKISYYQQIYRYIKARLPASNHNVIINPGVEVDEGYLDRSVADTIVIFENYQKVWANYHPPAYVKKYSPQHFAALIHTTTDRKLMKSTLDRAVKSKFGYVYITNDSTDTTNRNPWDTLPTYWQAEVNYIQQLNNVE
ncbi:spherulation-specific family 4 protein [Chamaesiphon sp. VAR_69_metabat_338]|uniref:spherulation-specific family 4 protein n=1 Tax=Chamaesiphon sp. VAR_69_metabat_338 TaxID=2964704 RepID=UPI00286DA3A7|nr:spherulation-specific family 4 protein [Chamaesiphon sp. VAR_69_metabat_338]